MRLMDHNYFDIISIAALTFGFADIALVRRINY